MILYINKEQEVCHDIPEFLRRSIQIGLCLDPELHYMTQTLYTIDVNIWNVQTCTDFFFVYLSQIDDNCLESKSQWIEKILQGIAVLSFYTLESEEET